MKMPTSSHIYSPYLPHTTQTGSPGTGYLCSYWLLTPSMLFVLAGKMLNEKIEKILKETKCI